MTPEYYAANKEAVKAQQKAYYWANADRIRAKKRDYARKRRLTHRDHLNALARANKATRPERVRRTQFKSHIKLRYGLSVEEYRNLLIGQAGRCLICLRADRGLVVDHDHQTGLVRGLLCGSCNKMLGLAADQASVLRRAAAFLG